MSHSSYMASSVEIVRSPKPAAALLHPDRARLLELLAEPDSAAGLARKLNLPRQQVNYHLRELEALGLVQFIEERRKGNCVERMVRATARSYLISPEAIGPLGCGCAPCNCATNNLVPLEAHARTSSSHLLEAASRLIRQQTANPQPESASVSEAELRFSTPAERDACMSEIASFIAQVASRYNKNCETNPIAVRLLLAAWQLPSQSTTPEVQPMTAGARE